MSWPVAALDRASHRSLSSRFTRSRCSATTDPLAAARPATLLQHPLVQAQPAADLEVVRADADACWGRASRSGGSSAGARRRCLERRALARLHQALGAAEVEPVDHGGEHLARRGVDVHRRAARAAARRRAQAARRSRASRPSQASCSTRRGRQRGRRRLPGCRPARPSRSAGGDAVVAVSGRHAGGLAQPLQRLPARLRHDAAVLDRPGCAGCSAPAHRRCCRTGRPRGRRRRLCCCGPRRERSTAAPRPAASPRARRGGRRRAVRASSRRISRAQSSAPVRIQAACARARSARLDLRPRATAARPCRRPAC